MVGLPEISKYMDTRPHALRPDTDILDAVEYLLTNHVTGAPVIDAQGTPIGMLTERECLKLIAEGADSETPRGVVRDFMNTDFQTAPPNLDIYYAAGVFLKEGNYQRRMLVVEDGKLLGVITRYDILRAIEVNFKKRAE